MNYIIKYYFYLNDFVIIGLQSCKYFSEELGHHQSISSFSVFAKSVDWNALCL